MDLSEEFKKETGLSFIVEDGMGNSFYTEDYVEWLEDRVKKLSISDVSKCKFAVQWKRSPAYGIGGGTEYFYAEKATDALKEFWTDKDKEAFEVTTVYVC